MLRYSLDFARNSLYGALMAVGGDPFIVTGETLKKWGDRLLTPAVLGLLGAAAWQIFWGIPGTINDNKVEIVKVATTGQYLTEGLNELKEDNRRLRKDFDEARKELNLAISRTESKLLASLKEQRTEVNDSIRAEVNIATYRIEVLMRQLLSEAEKPPVESPKKSEKPKEEKPKPEKQ